MQHAQKFSDEEREWIRQKLLTEARHHFETAGLRKTSVEDLTKAAGIAQGSFYMFFGSKEELYYELILEEGGEFAMPFWIYSLLKRSAVRKALNGFSYIHLG